MKTLTLSRWKDRIMDVYRTAQFATLTSDALQGRLAEHVYKELHRTTGGRAVRRVYSAYVQGYVAGIVATEVDHLYRDHLEFCYRDPDTGQMWSPWRGTTHRSTEEFYADHRGAELGKLPSGYYWRGTSAPFYAALTYQDKAAYEARIAAIHTDQEA